jgi:hypothetical protein
MDDNELYRAFNEIRRLGKSIRPRSEFDSVAVTCATQFEFVYQNTNAAAVVALCDRLLNHLVTADDNARRLSQVVRAVEREMRSRLT